MTSSAASFGPAPRSRAAAWRATWGMSVVPVTDALRRLEGDGLLESRARAGTRVRVPTEKVEALVSGDPARADAAMRAHVRYGLAEVTGQIGALSTRNGASGVGAAAGRSRSLPAASAPFRL